MEIKDLRNFKMTHVGKEVHNDESKRRLFDDPFHGLKINDTSFNERHKDSLKHMFKDSDKDGMPNVLSSGVYHNSLNEFKVKTKRMI